ncbi:hypothetical protein BLA39750_02953 [Burkholderia lata]|uniref:Uncharacterized protein n=1 Tax=Burkholderia lata (strain ATCC 17760 / DSM 23089 / LMG 22485 / NCIMB 9086 / R18194 / 383) TaxID=482957 RepID=A0A6P2XF06_BURL3|nr:hypothetical protein [Burkholderia lata]VWD06885.1 hypothetical protein BLA39750_02953 [Burkholderia lata]
MTAPTAPPADTARRPAPVTDAIRAYAGIGPARTAMLSISGRMRGGMAFALLGFLACDLPTRLHGAPPSWIWSGIGAMACGVVGYSTGSGSPGRCARRSMLWCMAAICAGLTLDAMRSPLDAILNLCGGTLEAGAMWNTLVLHLQWFPMSMLAMLALLIRREADRRGGHRRSTVRVLVRAAVRVALECAAMLLVMALGMTAIKALALGLGLRWDTGGVAVAMLVGMLAFYALSDRAARAEVSLKDRLRNKNGNIT